MTPSEPLNPDNVEDLVRLFMDRVDDLAKDMGRRFTSTNRAVRRIDVKVTKIDGRIGTIEQARHEEAALSAQAKDIGDRQAIKDEKAVSAKIDAAAASSLSLTQKRGLVLAGLGIAVTAVCGLADVVAHIFGVWH